jgi:hypothetical protein
VKPVWIKYYGFIPMTRSGYLIAMAVAGSAAAFIVLMSALAGYLPPLNTMWSSRYHLPGRGIGVWLYNYCYWFLLVCLIAQAIDTFCTLRLFAKKEAEQRAQLEAEWDRLGEGRRGEPGEPETHVRGDEPERRAAPTDYRGRP